MRIVPWIVIVALSLPLPATTQVQTSPWSPVRVVLSGGAGTGSRVIAGNLAVSVGGPRREVIVRSAAVWDFEIFAPMTDSQDIAVRAAVRTARSRSWYRAAAGVGYVRQDTDGCWYECPGSSTVGLAWQADAVFAAVRALGIGAQLFGNLNTVDTFVGLVLSLHLGAMR